VGDVVVASLDDMASLRAQSITERENGSAKAELVIESAPAILAVGKIGGDENVIVIIGDDRTPSLSNSGISSEETDSLPFSRKWPY